MFQITTDPSTEGIEWTSPLWWSGQGVVGSCRFREAAQFATKGEAEAALAAIPASARRFYSLAVTPTPPERPFALSGHGWMVGHPGYDLA